MLMKSKIQRALNTVVLGAVAAPVLMSVGCYAGTEESGSTEVLRTYKGQTEVVTIETQVGELQTVLVDAEGEERAQVTRDLDGNRTGAVGNHDLPAELLNALGDELQPVHELLHAAGQSLSGVDEGATAPAHADSDASLLPDTDPAAAPSILCRINMYNGRWTGTAVDFTPQQISRAQCAGWANSCGSNAVVEFFASYQPRPWESGDWYSTHCIFSTAP